MLIHAAEFAGLNVLSLVHENTAAALMYGIDTKGLVDEVPRTVLFVNMGSDDFELSIVRYGSFQKDDKKKKILTIEVLDEAGINNTGGNTMSQALIHIMAEKYDAQPNRAGKPSVKTVPRAM